MKKLAAALIAVMLFSSIAFAEGDSAVHSYLNGYDLNQTDRIQTFIADNRTYIPLKLLTEASGLEITPNEKGDSFQLIKGDKAIYMTLGEKQYKSGTASFDMDVAPFERDGEVYFPLRYVAEAFGLKVDWDEANRIALFGSYREEVDFQDESRMTTKEGYSFVIPEKLKEDFVVEDLGGEVKFYDKKNYRRADHIGRIGTISKVKDPRTVDVPMILLQRLPGGYLIFTFSETSGISADASEELKASYDKSREDIKDVLKTAKTLERVSLR